MTRGPISRPPGAGWVRQLELAGSAHLSYTDLLPMTARLEAAGLLTHEQRVEIAGAVDADRGVAAQRAYVAAFFDQHLRVRDCGLFDGPSPAYPEIGFV